MHPKEKFEGMVLVPKTQDGVVEIAERLPPISNLNSIRRALPDSGRVGTGVVAGDNLGASTVSRLLACRGRFTVKQNMDNIVASKIASVAPR